MNNENFIFSDQKDSLGATSKISEINLFNNKNTSVKTDYDLKLPYNNHAINRKKKYISNDLYFPKNQDLYTVEDKIYRPPEEKIHELCGMFDILYYSDDNMPNLEFEEIKRLRSLCIILEQSNNDLEYVTKRLDHENKCHEPRINQLREINKNLIEDNAEYLGRSVENRFLLKDVEKLKELLDALTNAVNEEVNNHCRLQEEYFTAEFNRKQFEKDKMTYELSSVATSYQLNNLTMKKAYLESCKEDMIKKQVYINRLQDIKGLIRVMVKIRISQNANKESIFSFLTDDKIGIKMFKSTNKFDKVNVDEVKVYQFNKVFKPDSSSVDISDAVGGSISQLINGYNVCFLHFGASGSGKTHSVFGNFQNEYGISGLLIGKLIDEMNKEHRMRFKIEVSFLEFYNDNIICLLSGKKIKFKDTGQKIIINGYNKESIVTLKNYNRYLQQVSQKRQTSSTHYCAQSSRSHLVIMISIKSENEINLSKTKSRLLICDLAGFEKSNYNYQNFRKQHMDETYHINNSLSSLSQIIEECNLYKGKLQYLSNRKCTLPFRSSKLTQFLKPCFCGDAYCYLILHVSDELQLIHSTYKTLELGQTAMSTELGKPVCHKTENGSRNIKHDV